MAQSCISSLVFVGAFPPGMFDEGELFGGELDSGQRLDIGLFFQCSYASGKYRFQTIPERIDLRAGDPEIVPGALVDAARTIVAKMKSAHRAVRVSGFGMNCDTVFDRQSIGVRGADYCSRLVDPKVTTLVNAQSLDSLTKVRFKKDTFRYEVRFEPHMDSLSDGLFVAVNGHQDVDKVELLDDKLQRVDAFRAYVGELHRRILNSERSI